MKSRSKTRGFTLIEMLIVIVVMGVLMALALPMYNTSITRSKEARLHHNLVTLNNLIQQYTLDKKAAPQQLDDVRDVIACALTRHGQHGMASPHRRDGAMTQVGR